MNFTAAADGSLLLAIPLALLAGLASFFSPCVIPLLPGFLSCASGISGAELASSGGPRGRLVLGASLFVAGFSAVFVLLGLAVGALASWAAEYRGLIQVVLGLLTVVLGLGMLGAFPALQREVRLHRLQATGIAVSPVLGALYALGWTPCAGPTLGVILNIAAVTGGARAGLLLLVYSVGLGVPFVLAASAWRRTTTAVAWIRRRGYLVPRFGGAALIVVGVLLISGLWQVGAQWLQVRLVDHWAGFSL